MDCIIQSVFSGSAPDPLSTASVGVWKLAELPVNDDGEELQEELAYCPGLAMHGVNNCPSVLHIEAINICFELVGSRHVEISKHGRSSHDGHEQVSTKSGSSTARREYSFADKYGSWGDWYE